MLQIEEYCRINEVHHNQILYWFLFSICHVCVSEGSGSAKAGGGGNAREIRIRKTKKKGRREEDSDEETGMSQQSTALWSSHFWSDLGSM